MNYEFETHPSMYTSYLLVNLFCMYSVDDMLNFSIAANKKICFQEKTSGGFFLPQPKLITVSTETRIHSKPSARTLLSIVSNNWLRPAISAITKIKSV